MWEIDELFIKAMLMTFVESLVENDKNFRKNIIELCQEIERKNKERRDFYKIDLSEPSHYKVSLDTTDISKEMKMLRNAGISHS